MNECPRVCSIHSLTRVCIHPLTQVCKEIIVEMTRASAGAMVKE